MIREISQMDSGDSTEESPVRTKKGESYAPRKRKASDLNQKSPLGSLESVAEFFAENKKIAGFDNPGKSLYSTVRELVENALDSAEAGGVLPSVEVAIKELKRSKVKSMSGGIDEKQLGKKVKGGTASFYRVTCQDNGRGMSENDVTNLFGKGLSRKRCGVKQTRGSSGLGAKMALIWSKMSTGKPVEISTSRKNQDCTEHMCVDIDIGMPNIHSHEVEDWKAWDGTKIKVSIEGDWKGYRRKILKYMCQMAVITPHAEFVFNFIGAQEHVFEVYKRRTTVMPALSLSPLAEDLSLLMVSLSESCTQNLLEFVQHEFVDIGEEVATKLIGDYMGPDVTSNTQVNSLTVTQALMMKDLFRHAHKYSAARGGGRLIPVGEENLRLGIKAHLRADAIATTFAGSGEGHPFIVEVGVCLGGKHLYQGLRVFRFANRVPLLFDEEDDVVTTTVKHRINWEDYKINPELHRVSVVVSIVSTKIPFKWPGMECIGDETGEIAVAVKTCVDKCCCELLPIINVRIQAYERALKSMMNCVYKPPSHKIVRTPRPHKLFRHHITRQTGKHASGRRT